MAKVRITWTTNASRLSNIDNSKLDYLDGKGFYAIYACVYNKDRNSITPKKLLYIGQAFEQTIRERLKQPHDADACMKKEKQNEPNSGLWFKTGVITKNDQEKVTQQLFNDVECCMIYVNKPKCNTLCIETYEGGAIEVTHGGARMIKNSSCE
ncbi:hypothetical protein ES703_28986 [subsurface metagenome]